MTPAAAPAVSTVPSTRHVIRFIDISFSLCCRDQAVPIHVERQKQMLMIPALRAADRPVVTTGIRTIIPRCAHLAA
jgi:hypothetical protein